MAKLSFNSVARIGDREFLTFIAGNELANLWKEGKIEYTPEIQRGAKVKINSKNETVLKAIYSPKNVKKIEEEIISGRYCTDMITLNILEDDDSIVDFKKNTLTVDGTVSILDGQHRVRALANLNKKAKKGTLEVDLSKLIFPIKITYYDLAKAQQQFYQFSLGLKISSSRAEYFNQKDAQNVMLKEVIENSALKDKVELVRNTIPKKEENKIVSFATLVNAVKDTYKIIENKEEQDELADYLIEFFNELFKVVPEFNDFEARNELKKESLLPENIMFYGYVALSKVIKDNPEWKDILASIRSLDLDKDSENWVSKVTKEGANGYSIINSSDSRKYLVFKLEKLIKERNQMLSK